MFLIIDEVFEGALPRPAAGQLIQLEQLFLQGLFAGMRVDPG